MTNSEGEPQANEPEIGAGQYEVGDDRLDEDKAQPQVQPDMPSRSKHPIEDPEIASGHRDE